MASPYIMPISGIKLTTIDIVGGIYCHLCRNVFSNKQKFDPHYSIHAVDGAEIVYTCVICYKEFKAYPSFRGHCYKHVIKDKHKCKHCENLFSKRSDLRDHINSMHLFKCNKPSCKKQFRSKKELHIHQILHKNEKNSPPYQCQTCEETILTRDSCEDHIDQHSTIIYTCPICDQTITKEQVFKHLTTHFDDVNYGNPEEKYNNTKKIPETPIDCSITIMGGIYCHICHEMFKDRLDFDAHHSADHENEDIFYTCNICKKRFETYNLFGLHCYEHFTKNRFECDTCKQTFSRLSSLVLHTASAHVAGDCCQFRCGLCSESFATSRRLREHLRAKHEMSGYTVRCVQVGCNSTFETPKELILHQNTHHNAALDKWCRQCGLQFPTLASCQRHIDVHIKTMVPCPVCGRQFLEKHITMKHIGTHFESVLHLCNVCGRSYATKARLAQHVKVHSSLKNFPCNLCNKSFAKPFQLRDHLNMHQGNKPYQCNACPKTFGCYPNWAKHLRKIHGIDSRTVKKPKLDTAENSPASVINDKAVKEIKIDDTLINSELFDTEDSTMDSGLDLDDVKNELEIFGDKMETTPLNTDDLAELTNVLLDNTDAFVPEPALVTEPLETFAPPAPLTPVSTVDYPREYGPDFVNQGEGSEALGGEYIDLDDHILPHIDPHAINMQTDMYAEQTALDPEEQKLLEDLVSAWEPPVFSKVCDHWELDDVTALSLMNADIF